MVRENVGTEGSEFFSADLLDLHVRAARQFDRLIPYTFTFTGQIVVTFALAISCSFWLRLSRSSARDSFLHLLLPKGAPIVMAPILVPIEIISYLSRPVSLGIRLFANMMAGTR